MTSRRRKHKPSTPQFASTRGNARIDYSSKAVMKKRREAKLNERRLYGQWPWIIGRFVVRRNICHIEAVPMEVGWWIDDDQPLTTHYPSFARWRTRQGARQWLLEHPRPGCRLVNLEQLATGDASEIPVVEKTT